MKLSQGEKLILLALADMKDGKQEVDLAFVRKAIISGNSWALSWEVQAVPEEDTDAAVATETAEILGMWGYLEHCIGELHPTERDKLASDAKPFSLSFSGFDGNNDAHYHVATFMIRDMDRFEEFKGRNMNSHSQGSLPTYRDMLERYRKVNRDAGFSGRSFTAEQILAVVRP